MKTYQTPYENIIKDGLQDLIENIIQLEWFDGTISDLPDKVLTIVWQLEKHGVDFSGVEQMGWKNGKTLLEALIASYNEAYPAEKITAPIEATKSVLQNTLTLSSQAQARQEALNNWSEKNPKLAKSLEWKITIDNNGISIETKAGTIPFGFEGVIWDQRFDVERYPKGTFTRDQLTVLILMLWGRIYRNRYNHADAWKEAVSFFTEVLWLKETLRNT